MKLADFAVFLKLLPGVRRIALVFALGILAFCGHASGQTFPLALCNSSDGTLGIRWIVNAGSLHRAVSALSLQEQRTYFDTPCTFMIAKQRIQPYSAWNSVGTISIRSAREINRCCEQGVGAVMYDPESWQFTPPEEQRNPADFACKIATVVHAQGRLLIVAPAADLVGGGPQRFERFLKAKIAESMARCADVYEIQSQGTELDIQEFQSYVRRAVKQARGANPNIIILAGISTNPTGNTVSAKQLYACIKSVSDVVSGYWLNIPAGGTACPTCGEPKPEVAAELLKLMSK